MSVLRGDCLRVPEKNLHQASNDVVPAEIADLLHQAVLLHEAVLDSTKWPDIVRAARRRLVVSRDKQ